MPTFQNHEKLGVVRALLNDNGMPKNEFRAAREPTPNDDLGQGWEIGSRWIFGSREWVCKSAAYGFAVWDLATGDAVVQAQLPPYTPFRSVAEIGVTSVPADLPQITAVINGLAIAWGRDPSGTLMSADGATWSPLGDIYPEHFGAVGDGSTDDTAAINAALAYIRANGNLPISQRPVTLRGGNKTYLCRGSLNATNIANAKGWRITDLFIKSEAYNVPVIDMSGSRWWYLDNLQIWGGNQINAALRPWSGILLARTTEFPNSHGTMVNVNVDGFFLGSALHHYAAEEVCAVQSTFWNRAVASGSATPTDPDYAPAYATIFDGRGRLPCKSQFATLVTGRQSNTVNNWISCAFQKPYGTHGPTVYVSDIASWNFDKAYMTNGLGGVFDWFLFDDFTCYSVHINGLQVETEGNQRIFNFTPGVAGSLTSIRDLRFSMGNIFSSDEVMRFWGATGLVTLQNAHIDLPRWNAAPPTNGLAFPKARFGFSGGNIAIQESASFSPVSDFAVFTPQAYTYESGTTTNFNKISAVNGIFSVLPTYASNAAAISGGLAVNDFYRTTAGEVRVVV